MDFSSIYSHQLSQPDPQQRQAGLVMLERFRRDLPGGWSDDRAQQVRHYTGLIYIAVSTIAELYGTASYEVMRRRKRTVAKAQTSAQQDGRDDNYEVFDDEDHPLVKLIKRPNEIETFEELAHKLWLQNRLTGVAPLWTVPNSDGQPVELWSLKTSLTYPTYQLSRQYPRGAWRVYPPTGYGVWAVGGLLLGTAGATIPGEEVARFMEPHPYLIEDGYSPLTAGATYFDVLEAIDTSRKTVMDQGLNLSGVLTIPGVKQEVLEDAVRRQRQSHGGAERHGGILGIAFDPGLGDKAGFTPFNQSARDMDYSQGWEQLVKATLGVFKVPAIVAGLTDGGYAELFAATKRFYKAQEFGSRRFQSWLSRNLAEPWSEYPGEFLIRCTFPEIDDHDIRAKAFDQQLQNDLLTYNESRLYIDREPVDGGDIPRSLYLKKLEQDLMPQDQGGGMPGMEGMEGGGDGGDMGGGGETDPLAALLGGDGPTAGAPPSPENPDAEGSLPPRPGSSQDTPSQSTKPQSSSKASTPQAAPGMAPAQPPPQDQPEDTEPMEIPWWVGDVPDSDMDDESQTDVIRKAGSAAGKNEGDVWQGESGRWFTLKDGRPVPAKAPGGADEGGQQQSAQQQNNQQATLAFEEKDKDKADQQKPTDPSAGSPAATTQPEKPAGLDDWQAPDWYHSPTDKSQNRWRNRFTGAVKYAKERPGGRSEKAKKEYAEQRARRLAKPPRVRLSHSTYSEAEQKAALAEEYQLTHDHLAAMLGGVDGTDIGAYMSDRRKAIQFTLDHPDTSDWNRTLVQNADGSMTLYNNTFFLRPAAQGAGFGTQAFANQVRGCVEAGVGAISTCAGRGMLGGVPMNGYYTWPTLGYDAPLDPRLRKKLPESLQDAMTVQDLYETDEGKAWWKQHGECTTMRFDVSPGSRSMKKLNAYLAKKGLPPIEYTEEHAKQNADKKSKRQAVMSKSDAERHMDRVHENWATRASEMGFSEQDVRKAAEAGMGNIYNPRSNPMKPHELLDASYQFAINQLGVDRVREWIGTHLQNWQIERAAEYTKTSTEEIRDRLRAASTFDMDVLAERDPPRAAWRALASIMTAIRGSNVEKAMNTLSMADGGALVKSPEYRRRRKKKVKRAVRNILKGLCDE